MKLGKMTLEFRVLFLWMMRVCIPLEAIALTQSMRAAFFTIPNTGNLCEHTSYGQCVCTVNHRRVQYNTKKEKQSKKRYVKMKRKDERTPRLCFHTVAGTKNAQ
mmetsp:Transcript_5764/g.8902  ORF Transcript_5764/g.8902 Transcript_5764/m.8902 type:complete len:104 (+) Transcript_5764:263-574(+)